MTDQITFKQPAPVVKVPEIKKQFDPCGYTLSVENLLKHQTITNQSGLATKTESIGSSICEEEKYPKGVEIARPVRSVQLSAEALNTNSITYKYGYSDVGSLEDPNYKRQIQKGVRDKLIVNTYGFRKGEADTVSGYAYEQIQNKSSAK